VHHNSSVLFGSSADNTTAIPDALREEPQVETTPRIVPPPLSRQQTGASIPSDNTPQYRHTPSGQSNASSGASNTGTPRPELANTHTSSLGNQRLEYGRIVEQLRHPHLPRHRPANYFAYGHPHHNRRRSFQRPESLLGTGEPSGSDPRLAEVQFNTYILPVSPPRRETRSDPRPDNTAPHRSTESDTINPHHGAHGPSHLALPSPALANIPHRRSDYFDPAWTGSPGSGHENQPRPQADQSIPPEFQRASAAPHRSTEPDAINPAGKAVKPVRPPQQPANFRRRRMDYFDPAWVPRSGHENQPAPQPDQPGPPVRPQANEPPGRNSQGTGDNTLPPLDLARDYYPILGPDSQPIRYQMYGKANQRLPSNDGAAYQQALPSIPDIVHEPTPDGQPEPHMNDPFGAPGTSLLPDPTRNARSKLKRKRNSSYDEGYDIRQAERVPVEFGHTHQLNPGNNIVQPNPNDSIPFPDAPIPPHPVAENFGSVPFLDALVYLYQEAPNFDPTPFPPPPVTPDPAARNPGLAANHSALDYYERPQGPQPPDPAPSVNPQPQNPAPSSNPQPRRRTRTRAGHTPVYPQPQAQSPSPVGPLQVFPIDPQHQSLDTEPALGVDPEIDRQIALDTAAMDRSLGINRERPILNADAGIDYRQRGMDTQRALDFYRDMHRQIAMDTAAMDRSLDIDRERPILNADAGINDRQQTMDRRRARRLSPDVTGVAREVAQDARLEPNRQLAQDIQANPHPNVAQDRQLTPDHQIAQNLHAFLNSQMSPNPGPSGYASVDHLQPQPLNPVRDGHRPPKRQRQDPNLPDTRFPALSPTSRSRNIPPTTASLYPLHHLAPSGDKVWHATVKVNRTLSEEKLKAAKLEAERDHFRQQNFERAREYFRQQEVQPYTADNVDQRRRVGRAEREYFRHREEAVGNPFRRTSSDTLRDWVRRTRRPPGGFYQLRMYEDSRDYYGQRPPRVYYQQRQYEDSRDYYGQRQDDNSRDDYRRPAPGESGDYYQQQPPEVDDDPYLEPAAFDVSRDSFGQHASGASGDLFQQQPPEPSWDSFGRWPSGPPIDFFQQQQSDASREYFGQRPPDARDDTQQQPDKGSRVYFYQRPPAASRDQQVPGASRGYFQQATYEAVGDRFGRRSSAEPIDFFQRQRSDASREYFGQRPPEAGDNFQQGPDEASRGYFWQRPPEASGDRFGRRSSDAFREYFQQQPSEASGDHFARRPPGPPGDYFGQQASASHSTGFGNVPGATGRQTHGLFGQPFGEQQQMPRWNLPRRVGSGRTINLAQVQGFRDYVQEGSSSCVDQSSEELEEDGHYFQQRPYEAPQDYFGHASLSVDPEVGNNLGDANGQAGDLPGEEEEDPEELEEGGGYFQEQVSLTGILEVGNAPSAADRDDHSLSGQEQVSRLDAAEFESGNPEIENAPGAVDRVDHSLSGREEVSRLDAAANIFLQLDSAVGSRQAGNAPSAADRDNLSISGQEQVSRLAAAADIVRMQEAVREHHDAVNALDEAASHLIQARRPDLGRHRDSGLEAFAAFVGQRAQPAVAEQAIVVNGTGDEASEQGGLPNGHRTESSIIKQEQQSPGGAAVFSEDDEDLEEFDEEEDDHDESPQLPMNYSIDLDMGVRLPDSPRPEDQPHDQTVESDSEDEDLVPVDSRGAPRENGRGPRWVQHQDGMMFELGRRRTAEPSSHRWIGTGVRLLDGETPEEQPANAAEEEDEEEDEDEDQPRDRDQEEDQPGDEEEDDHSAEPAQDQDAEGIELDDLLSSEWPDVESDLRLPDSEPPPQDQPADADEKEDRPDDVEEEEDQPAYEEGDALNSEPPQAQGMERIEIQVPRTAEPSPDEEVETDVRLPDAGSPQPQDQPADTVEDTPNSEPPQDQGAERNELDNLLGPEWLDVNPFENNHNPELPQNQPVHADDAPRSSESMQSIALKTYGDVMSSSEPPENKPKKKAEKKGEKKGENKDENEDNQSSELSSLPDMQGESEDADGERASDEQSSRPPSHSTPAPELEEEENEDEEEHQEEQQHEEDEDEEEEYEDDEDDEDDEEEERRRKSKSFSPYVPSEGEDEDG
jgi:hypothetical protein